MSRSFCLRLTVIPALLFGCCTHLSAADLTPPPPPLTLAEALRLADTQNPTLLAQGHAARVSAALIDQAGQRPNPTLDVALENFAGTGAVRGVDALETTVQASQVIERGGKRDKRLALATRERDVADLDFALRRTEVLTATVTAYVELLAAQQHLALADTTLALAAETADAVALRVKAASASAAETARSRASLATARADHARAASAVTRARTTLAASWGGTASDVPVLTGALPVPAALPAPDPWLAKLAAHPRLALQQSVISSRRASVQLAQSQAVQDFTVGAGLRFFRQNSDAALVAGVSIPLPFRSQNQGNIRAARETLAGAEQALRSAEVELRTAFTAAWQELQTASAVARNLRRDALPASKEALALVRTAYARGELPLFDVLDAQRAHASLHRDILDADIATATALVRLEALVDPSFPLTTALLSVK